MYIMVGHKELFIVLHDLDMSKSSCKIEKCVARRRGYKP